MITIRLGDEHGVALLIDPAAVAAQIEAHLPALILGSQSGADMDPMTDAIRAAIKVPTRMLLRAIKGELQRKGYPEAVWPRKVERGEDTLLYAARYLVGLLLSGAEGREWVADYADNPDTGDIQIRALRTAASADTPDAADIPGAADRVAALAAGAGAGADGAGGACAADSPAPTDDGRPGGADAPPVDGAGLARAPRLAS